MSRESKEGWRVELFKFVGFSVTVRVSDGGGNGGACGERLGASTVVGSELGGVDLLMANPIRIDAPINPPMIALLIKIGLDESGELTGGVCELLPRGDIATVGFSANDNAARVGELETGVAIAESISPAL